MTQRGAQPFRWYRTGDRARWLAEFERHLILSRTDEGRKRAMANVVKFGRKPKLTKHQRQEALEDKDEQDLMYERENSQDHK
jgi:DNA invertase Pin-like site-specific DNA recombinase